MVLAFGCYCESNFNLGFSIHWLWIEIGISNCQHLDAKAEYILVMMNFMDCDMTPIGSALGCTFHYNSAMIWQNVLVTKMYESPDGLFNIQDSKYQIRISKFGNSISQLTNQNIGHKILF